MCCCDKPTARKFSFYGVCLYRNYGGFSVKYLQIKKISTITVIPAYFYAASPYIYSLFVQNYHDKTYYILFVYPFFECMC